MMYIVSAVHLNLHKDLKDSVYFSLYDDKNEETDMVKKEFYRHKCRVIGKQSHEVSFFLTNGANDSISSKGGGTTGAFNKLSKKFFDTKQLKRINDDKYSDIIANNRKYYESNDFKDHNYNVVSREIKDHLKNSKNEEFMSKVGTNSYGINIMVPYVINNIFEKVHKDFEVNGVYHIHSISSPGNLQVNLIYKLIYIDNIKKIILNCIENSVKNRTSCLYLCSTPGALYNGSIILNTNYMVQAVNDLNDEIVKSGIKIFIDGDSKYLAYTYYNNEKNGVNGNVNNNQLNTGDINNIKTNIINGNVNNNPLNAQNINKQNLKNNGIYWFLGIIVLFVLFLITCIDFDLED